MDKNVLVLSTLPEEWQEKFYIKRIDEEDIEITLVQRNAILEALNKGNRFVQIGKYTLMLNSIKSIDPRFEPENIPPMPKSDMYFHDGKDVDGNEPLQILWEKYNKFRLEHPERWRELQLNYKGSEKKYIGNGKTLADGK